MMPTVLDRHIESEDQNAFGHRHYAEALRYLIEDERHQRPFSIGLLGGWGYRQELSEGAIYAGTGSRYIDCWGESSPEVSASRASHSTPGGLVEKNKY